jgi:hypothetical protein
MLFQSREFHVPKDYDTPQYYEDSAAVNLTAGRVAIADGVSSAVFSGAWADILTQSVVANPPQVRDPAQFASWLADRRKEWAAGINVPSLPYHLLMKLRQVGGGFATLAWVEVQRQDGEKGSNKEYFIRGQGVGDACVFQVRDGQILAKWPMRESADFEADPISIGSVNFQRDASLEFQEFEWHCRTGDLLVLATDAVSAWIYRMLEAGEVVNLDDLSHLPDADLAEYLKSLRESHWLKRDDSTIVFIGLGQTQGFLEQSNQGDSRNETGSVDGTDSDVQKADGPCAGAGIVACSSVGEAVPSEVIVEQEEAADGAGSPAVTKSMLDGEPKPQCESADAHSGSPEPQPGATDLTVGTSF